MADGTASSTLALQDAWRSTEASEEARGELISPVELGVQSSPPLPDVFAAIFAARETLALAVPSSTRTADAGNGAAAPALRAGSSGASTSHHSSPRIVSSFMAPAVQPIDSAGSLMELARLDDGDVLPVATHASDSSHEPTPFRSYVQRTTDMPVRLYLSNAAVDAKAGAVHSAVGVSSPLRSDRPKLSSPTFVAAAALSTVSLRSEPAREPVVRSPVQTASLRASVHSSSGSANNAFERSRFMFDMLAQSARARSRNGPVSPGKPPLPIASSTTSQAQSAPEAGTAVWRISAVRQPLKLTQVVTSTPAPASLSVASPTSPMTASVTALESALCGLAATSLPTAPPTGTARAASARSARRLSLDDVSHRQQQRASPRPPSPPTRKRASSTNSHDVTGTPRRVPDAAGAMLPSPVKPSSSDLLDMLTESIAITEKMIRSPVSPASSALRQSVQGTSQPMELHAQSEPDASFDMLADMLERTLAASRSAAANQPAAPSQHSLPDVNLHAHGDLNYSAAATRQRPATPHLQRQPVSTHKNALQKLTPSIRSQLPRAPLQRTSPRREYTSLAQTKAERDGVLLLADKLEQLLAGDADINDIADVVAQDLGVKTTVHGAASPSRSMREEYSVAGTAPWPEPPSDPARETFNSSPGAWSAPTFRSYASARPRVPDSPPHVWKQSLDIDEDVWAPEHGQSHDSAFGRPGTPHGRWWAGVHVPRESTRRPASVTHAAPSRPRSASQFQARGATQQRADAWGRATPRHVQYRRAEASVPSYATAVWDPQTQRIVHEPAGDASLWLHQHSNSTRLRTPTSQLRRTRSVSSASRQPGRRMPWERTL